MKENKKTVLFVCTGNAGRSQIAQALFVPIAGRDVTVLSAGVEPWENLHPVACLVLRERGVDITKLYPKHARSFAGKPLDWVITIGDRALAEIPRFSGMPTHIHWDISDPADADGTEESEAVFRATFAAIEGRMPALLQMMKNATHASSLHMEPGISTCVVRPDRFDSSRHLPLIAEAGFRCIELNCFSGSDDFQWDRPARVKELRRIAEDVGVRIYSVHAEGGIGGYRDAGSEQLAVDLCRSFADLAAELGAPVVTMHAGLGSTEDAATVSEQLGSSLECLSRHVLGMPCRYAWENEARGLSPVEHLEWIRKLNPGSFGFALDNGHSHINGTTDAYLSNVQGLLCNLHMNDNTAGRDEHLIPGAGSFRWNGFMTRLESSEYIGPLMLEIEARGRQGSLCRVLTEAHAAIDFIKRVGQAEDTESI